MGTKSYFCQKCKHKHRVTSKIGTQHINYRTKASIVKDETVKEIKIQSPKQAVVVKNKRSIKTIFTDYRKSYRNGVEKFGIWWTIFQLSVWGLAVIFLLTAAIIFVLYLPRIEMIQW